MTNHAENEAERLALACLVGLLALLSGDIASYRLG